MSANRRELGPRCCMNLPAASRVTRNTQPERGPPAFRGEDRRVGEWPRGLCGARSPGAGPALSGGCGRAPVAAGVAERLPKVHDGERERVARPQRVHRAPPRPVKQPRAEHLQRECKVVEREEARSRTFRFVFTRPPSLSPFTRPPSLSPNRTRRVPAPVLTGHAFCRRAVATRTQGDACVAL
jgi:hypothetical protein